MTYVSRPLRARVMSATALMLMPCGLLCLVLRFCPWFHLRTQAINKTVRWTLSRWYLIHNSDWTLQIPPCTWIGYCKILWRGVHSLVIISFHQQRSQADFFFNLICGNNANNDALLFLLTFRGDLLSFECLKCLLLHRCRSSCINGLQRRLWLAPYECLIGHHLLCSHCQWTTKTWRMLAMRRNVAGDSPGCVRQIGETLKPVCIWKVDLINTYTVCILMSWSCSMRRDEDTQPVALGGLNWSRSQFDVLHRLVPFFCEVLLYKLHSLTHFLPSSGALFGLAPIPLFLSFFLPLFLFSRTWKFGIWNRVISQPLDGARKQSANIPSGGKRNEASKVRLTIGPCYWRLFC